MESHLHATGKYQFKGTMLSLINLSFW